MRDVLCKQEGERELTFDVWLTSLSGGYADDDALAVVNLIALGQ
jgi:hypothetical protein